MNFQSIASRAGKWILVASFLGAGLAMAQAEPTLNQVYAAAQAGKLDEAQLMIQQVLISHPNSAKAYFVRAELYARQGDAVRAREALASADKLAPGLPFAKPESVQALRSQLAAGNSPKANQSASIHAPAQAATDTSSNWELPLLLAAGVIALGYFIFRRRSPAPSTPYPAGVYPNALSGPQSFGAGTATAPMYPQTSGPGLGSQIMGGVATGLAVGAGVMAAEAIGRNLMGNHGAATGQRDALASEDYQAINSNPDMGGTDFGVNDPGSWDDGGSVDGGGGWDN